LNTTQQLALISKAWGPQDGYAFFPWIPGTTMNRMERRRNWNEGPGFHWPEDRDEILKHMESHRDDDLYWCPNLFEKPQRKTEVAMDEHALWADLDFVDPRGIEKKYRPTVAWETSPGRYQALWLITEGQDIMGAAWEGGENHRMTRYLGADNSGWDATQVLRIPGWKNHKAIHRGGTDAGPNKKLGPPAEGKLLWAEKRRFLPNHFRDLPEVYSAAREVKEILEDEIGRVDRHRVWGRVRLLVSGRVREFVGAQEPTGDRSATLWEIERELADAGCSVVEIIAIVRATVWNKYEDRADELRRLTNEAAKAVSERKERPEKGLEDADAEHGTPQLFGLLIRDIKKPTWIVENILTKGSCGFIAGQPKTYKSWCALDLAFSVATGAPFLDHFEVKRPGPVLYIQEEDALPLLKLRTDKIWPNKEAYLGTPELASMPLEAMVGQGVTLSDPGWQSWLDDTMGSGKYTMVVMDPLIMLAGEVEENRAADMTNKIFRPLKQLAQKHSTAIVMVHHMRKVEGQGMRGGQMMLGSVANHAWAEDSLYFKLYRGKLQVERESKHTASGSFEIRNLKNLAWSPVVSHEGDDLDDAEEAPENGQVRRVRSLRAITGGRKPKALDALRELKMATTTEIAHRAQLTPNGAWRQLKRLEDAGKVNKQGKIWRLNGKG
jgi:AAA domain/RepB DNA-primase N-terminal domain